MVLTASSHVSEIKLVIDIMVLHMKGILHKGIIFYALHDTYCADNSITIDNENNSQLNLDGKKTLHLATFTCIQWWPIEN